MIKQNICLNPKCKKNITDSKTNLWCARCRNMPFTKRLLIFKSSSGKKDVSIIQERSYRRANKEEELSSVEFYNRLFARKL